MFTAAIMAISASASPGDPGGSSQHRRGADSSGRSHRAADLALKAFMSMNRAVAIVGPDGKPRDIRVSRPLGMGLDQKAIEADAKEATT